MACPDLRGRRSGTEKLWDPSIQSGCQWTSWLEAEIGSSISDIDFFLCICTWNLVLGNMTGYTLHYGVTHAFLLIQLQIYAYYRKITLLKVIIWLWNKNVTLMLNQYFWLLVDNNWTNFSKNKMKQAYFVAKGLHVSACDILKTFEIILRHIETFV